MRKTEWDIYTPDHHHVTVEHGSWSGKAIVTLDGYPIHRRPFKFWDTGLEHRFTVDDTPCIVRILLQPFSFTFELWVDGRLV